MEEEASAAGASSSRVAGAHTMLASRYRERGDNGDAANEGEVASSATKPGEDRERMTDHRRTGADISETPDAVVGQHHTDGCRRDAFGHVADEHGYRCPDTERLSCVPEARIAIADRSQIEVRSPPGHHVRHRDRADQIRDHDPPLRQRSRWSRRRGARGHRGHC